MRGVEARYWVGPCPPEIEKVSQFYPRGIIVLYFCDISQTAGNTEFSQGHPYPILSTQLLQASSF